MGLHGIVHELQGDGGLLLPVGVRAQDCLIKVAPDPGVNSAIRYEAEMYRECQWRKVTGTDGLVPELYVVGDLDDGRAFIVMQRLHWTRLLDLSDEEVAAANAALEQEVDELAELGIMHNDVRWDNAVYTRPSDEVSTGKVCIVLHWMMSCCWLIICCSFCIDRQCIRACS